MPQIQQINTYLSQIFWLVVCFAVLFFFLRNVALPKVSEVLETRRRKIEGDLEKAAALKAEAEAILAQYQKAMGESRERAQALLRQASEDAQKRAQAAQDTLGHRLAAEVKQAEGRIALARKDALANIERVAADLAQAATERMIGAQVDAATAQAAVGAVVRERGA